MRGSTEQLDAQLALKALDLLTERRLSNAELFSRAREVALTCNLDEIP
jgi:hypothetical protein